MYNSHYLARIKKRIKQTKTDLFYLFLSKKYPEKINTSDIRHGKLFSIDIKAKEFTISMVSTTFRDYCTIRIRKNGQLKIADNVFFNNNCSINCMEYIEIGSNTLFGENVKLYDHNHKFRDKSKLISQQDYSLGKITIGHRCWFGSNVVILKGVKIGNNVVIGANCVISENVPDNMIIRLTNDSLIRIPY